MNENILLACRDASLGYEGKAVWEHLDFQVRRGDYICIVGETAPANPPCSKACWGFSAPCRGALSGARG